MKKICVYIILIINIFSVCFDTTSFAASVTNSETSSHAQVNSNIEDLDIHSNCILMVEKETGDILYEKNAYEKMYPASTTKILTALLVLENCDLNETATVSSLALKAVPPTYVTCGLQVGEELRVEDLLYALLIPSANDAANVLAEHVSGSISGFADLMNSRAAELGCKNSHFANPSGVHDEGLYTTAYDLSLIARRVMDFETFRKIITTVTYTLPSTEVYPKADRTFTISNALINPKYKNYYYEYANGIKTGYTNAAKDCLVAGAKKDDVQFIIVTFGNGYLENGLREKYLDCKTLFEFAFDNYTAYYQNLQLEKEKKEKEIAKISLSTISPENFNVENVDSSTFKTISKIVAVVAILLALKIVFGKRKKKKNHYTRKGKKKKAKAKHYK